VVGLLAVAGCGGGEPEQKALPPLPAPLASGLAGRADAVAAKLEADDPCGARVEAEALQAETIAAVNAGRVPTPYQEELGAAVSSLVGSIECAPAPTATVEDGDDDEHEDDHGKGRDKDKGKHKGKGKK
jgi:hypothetical protein